jgi:hypothetical protein
MANAVFVLWFVEILPSSDLVFRIRLGLENKVLGLHISTAVYNEVIHKTTV